jgi:methylamine---glutamate N-methyltransferase subunit B
LVEIAATAIDASGLSTREVNAFIRSRLEGGPAEICIENPNARHNLAVALLRPGRVRFLGSVGYYCGGLIDGAEIHVEGSAGWGLAESMSRGHVVVHGGAGNGAAAAIRGGTVVIYGDAAARLGVSMKGGLVLVGGDCGYMAGFMGQKGTLVVCGNTGAAFADSMYATTCYVGGNIGALGTDAVTEPLSTEEAAMLDTLLAQHFPPELRAQKPAGRNFTKVVAGRKLWNFDKHNWKAWQDAL